MPTCPVTGAGHASGKIRLPHGIARHQVRFKMSSVRGCLIIFLSEGGRAGVALFRER